MKRTLAGYGFTVLELLVVIALILFLLSLIVIGAVYARRKAQVDRTQALLFRVELCATRYHQAMKEYPPPTSTDPGTLWRYLGRPAKNPRNGNSYSPPEKFMADELIAYDDPNHGPSFKVVDAWRTPVRFCGDPDQVRSRNGLDIESAGLDKQFNSPDDQTPVRQ